MTSSATLSFHPADRQAAPARPDAPVVWEGDEIARDGAAWRVDGQQFDAVILATPADAAAV